MEILPKYALLQSPVRFKRNAQGFLRDKLNFDLNKYSFCVILFPEKREIFRRIGESI